VMCEAVVMKKRVALKKIVNAKQKTA